MWSSFFILFIYFTYNQFITREILLFFFTILMFQKLQVKRKRGWRRSRELHVENVLKMKKTGPPGNAQSLISVPINTPQTEHTKYTGVAISRWFQQGTNPYTGTSDWIYTGGYFDRKYSDLPDIY